MQAEALNLGLPKSKHSSKKVTQVQAQTSFFAALPEISVLLTDEKREVVQTILCLNVVHFI